MRPPIDLAVTSPAEPVNSENAMDGMTFILQFLVAAADSDTNIQNVFIINYQLVTVHFAHSLIKYKGVYQGIIIGKEIFL